MIEVVFKNLDKSELAKEATVERIEPVLEKFPDLNQSRIRATLEMDNSPIHAGPDLFTVKVHVVGGRYRDIRIEKSAPNLYMALADVVGHMLEILNRFGDRERVKSRKSERRMSTSCQNRP